MEGQAHSDRVPVCPPGFLTFLPIGESGPVHCRIHHPLSSMGEIEEAHVRIFPRLSVGLHCGVAQFNFPDAELTLLAEDDSDGQPYNAAVYL